MDADKNQSDVIKLRKRIHDLVTLGYMGPESAGTYQQTLLQVWAETDRRRQSALHQAEVLTLQAKQAQAEANAFIAMSSILFNVVNAFAEAGEKQLRESAEREAERKAAEADKAPEANSIATEAALPGVDGKDNPVATKPKRKSRKVIV